MERSINSFKYTDEEKDFITALAAQKPGSASHQAIKQKLFEILKLHYGVQVVDHTSLVSSLDHQHSKAFQLQQELIAEGILRHLSSLNAEKRKEEIRDTSLINYLGNKFIVDTDELLYRNKTVDYPSDNQVTKTVEDYFTQRNTIIDALKFSLDKLEKNELIKIFSLFSSFDFSAQRIDYRSYRRLAENYIPEFREQLKLSYGVRLPHHRYSEKIISIPTINNQRFFLEFKYATENPSPRQFEQEVYLRIFPSEQSLRRQLVQDVSQMNHTIDDLSRLHKREVKDFEDSSAKQDLDFWKNKSRAIVQRGLIISYGPYIKDSLLRLEDLLNKNINYIAYRNFVHGLINNIQREVDTLKHKRDAIKLYSQFTPFSSVFPSTTPSR